MFRRNNCWFLSVLMVLINVGCKERNESSKINTIALVTNEKYCGNIVIFFEQDSEMGEINKSFGKHYFNVNSSNIFFTKLKLGDGNLENYTNVNGELKKVNYESEMSIKNVSDSSYQIIGCSARGIKHPLYKNGSKWLEFLSFKANRASLLKENWKIEDSAVYDIYSKLMSNQPNVKMGQ